MDHPIRILFLCTGNSARSIMAEALLETLGGDRFEAFSAGSFPAGTVQPLAAALAREAGFAGSLRSKSWDEFAADDAVALDAVVTVCDNAAGEVCPVWPGAPVTAHWGIPDPAAVAGSEGERRQAFEAAWTRLRARIGRLVALPSSELTAERLQEQLRSLAEVAA